MHSFRLDNYNFHSVYDTFGHFIYKGVYQDENNSYELEMEVPKNVVPENVTEKVDEFIALKVAPFLLNNQGALKCHALVISEERVMLKVGDDLNRRDQVIRELASRVVPEAPVLEGTLKKSPLTITDPQFWVDCSSQKSFGFLKSVSPLCKEWNQERIEVLGDELRKILKTVTLTWLLYPLFQESLYKKDWQLLQFLLSLEPKGLITLFVGSIPLRWTIFSNDPVGIEVILSFASNRPKCMSLIYDNIEMWFNHMAKFNHDSALEKLFDYYPNKDGRVIGNPYEFAKQWSKKDASSALNQKAAEYVCSKIKAEINKYPVYKHLLQEKDLPDLTPFHLPAEEAQKLLDDLKASFKASVETQPRKVLKSFTSDDRAMQIRSRQAGYGIINEALPTSFLKDRVGHATIKQKWSIPKIFIPFPQLTFSWQAESWTKSSAEAKNAIEEQIDSHCSLVTTSSHAMLIIREEGVFYLFDPNIGFFQFLDPKIFAAFSSEWIELWSPYTSEDPYDPDLVPVLQRYAPHMAGRLSLVQWPELSFEYGICAGFCLDLAEQLLMGMKKGKKVYDMLDTDTLGYTDFSVPNHLQTIVESYLERSQFSKAIQEWSMYAGTLGVNIRTALASLIARGNVALQKGAPQEAIETFKEAEEVLIKIESMEGMPSDPEKQKLKQKFLDERKRQIEKGIEIAQRIETKPPKPAEPPKAAVPEIRPWKPVAIVPISLKEDHQPV